MEETRVKDVEEKVKKERKKKHEYKHKRKKKELKKLEESQVAKGQCYIP